MKLQLRSVLRINGDMTQIFLRRPDDVYSGGLAIVITPGGRIMSIGYQGKMLFSRRKGLQVVKMHPDKFRQYRDIISQCVAAWAFGATRAEFEVEL